MKITLSDYIARFLLKQGIGHVFAISGGASLRLIHSIAETPGIDFVCPQNEQAGAMAADAYSRVTRNLGAAISTSGPGATNMMTGVCCAYYDSIPVIYITGQVATFRSRAEMGVRQLGFQETDTVDIFKSVTKYVVKIDDSARIRYELEKACYLARSGRPGPVLIDVPDNIQRELIDPDVLEPFVPAEEVCRPSVTDLQDKVTHCVQMLVKARRPVVILGWGTMLAGGEREAKKLIERLGFPVLPTWAMINFVPHDHPLLVGTFGTHGTRYGNYAVQNADLVLSIGCRLDTHSVGSPFSSFAREAKKIVVDVDIYELKKFEKFDLNIDLPINADARDFLIELNRQLVGLVSPDISEWRQTIRHWKKTYPICRPEYYQEKEVNPYVFVKTLSSFSSVGDVVVIDTGCAIAWMMQAFESKEEQKIFHDYNNTAMGYALPAAIGACFANGKKPVTCVVGDGSLQMSISELTTIVGHKLPIKIFLINNCGYSMIQQTQDQWFDSRYVASSIEGGLTFPDFVKVANAYGFETVTVFRNADLPDTLEYVMKKQGPVFCNVVIDAKHRVIPQVKFGRPIEDPEPLLDRKEFLANMVVKPIESSLKG